VKGWQLNIGDKCERGSQLRPNIVWFGEAVPMIEVAAAMVSKADIFLVVGTSMVVYPAAGLIDYVPDRVKKYVVDPNKPDILHVPNLEFITEKASVGLAKLKRQLTRGS
jgi:NAD-dependent deacetylase